MLSTKIKKIKLNLPTNYKSEVLFSKLPYLANFKSPCFQSYFKDFINSRKDLQKFLLATGDLGGSIQESLNLVVTDGKLNNAAVRRALDPTYKNVLQKPNPLEVVFKDILKFDTQYPIKSSLLTQIER